MGVYFIVTIMVIGMIPSTLMILPYPAKLERKGQYEKACQEQELIRCECSDWRLWVVRGLLLVAMFIATGRIFYECETWVEILAMCALYLAAFTLHYAVYLRLDRKYYVSPQGLWINKVQGMPVPYEQVEILRIWRTTAPFTGCSGNLKVRIKLETRNYTMTVPYAGDDEDDPDTSKPDSVQQKVLEWLPKQEQAKRPKRQGDLLRRIGIATILAGIAVMVVSGILVARGLGVGQGVYDASYKSVFLEEQARYGEISTIYEDNDGLLYALFEAFACVNVYDADGTFQYAYKVPVGINGDVEFAVQGPYMYIKNRDDNVYIYRGKTFEKETSLEKLQETVKLTFVEEESNMEKADILRKHSGLLPGDEALPFLFLGIAFVICGGVMYNKGRYSLYQNN